MPAVPSRLQPCQKLQGSFGVGARRPRDEQNMQPLARHTEQSRKFCLLAVTGEVLRAGAGQFIPKRCVGTRPEGFVTVTAPGFAVFFAGGFRRRLRRRDQSVGQGRDSVQLRR